MRENATYASFRALQLANTSFNALGSIVSIYETGRDNMAMLLYVTPNVKSVEEMFLRKAASHIAPHLIQQLSE